MPKTPVFFLISFHETQITEKKRIPFCFVTKYELITFCNFLGERILKAAGVAALAGVGAVAAAPIVLATAGFGSAGKNTLLYIFSFSLILLCSSFFQKNNFWLNSSREQCNLPIHRSKHLNHLKLCQTAKGRVDKKSASIFIFIIKNYEILFNRVKQNLENRQISGVLLHVTKLFGKEK